MDVAVSIVHTYIMYRFSEIKYYSVLTITYFEADTAVVSHNTCMVCNYRIILTLAYLDQILIMPQS